MSVASRLIDQLQEAGREPEGTVSFQLHSPDFLDESVAGGCVLEFVAGSRVFRLQRSDDLLLKFLYASPGTGTRIATIELSKLLSAEHFEIGFGWSPSRTLLSIRALSQHGAGETVSAEGELGLLELRVGSDGGVYQIGDYDVHAAGVRVTQGDRTVLEPTALGAWQSTKQAIDILRRAQSPEGFLFEVVVTNLTLVILATGLENYAKTRFLEIEGEGISPDLERLLVAFASKRERDANLSTILAQDAADAGVSPLRHFVAKGKINCQNCKELKRAFASAYGLRFDDINALPEDLSRVQECIRYRHRIVHVSPLAAMLRQPKSPTKVPVFANKETRSHAIASFGAFVDALHEATLRLRSSWSASSSHVCREEACRGVGKFNLLPTSQHE